MKLTLNQVDVLPNGAMIEYSLPKLQASTPKYQSLDLCRYKLCSSVPPALLITTLCFLCVRKLMIHLSNFPRIPYMCSFAFNFCSWQLKFTAKIPPKFHFSEIIFG